MDKLILGGLAPITSVLNIPESVGSITINCIASKAFQGENVIEKVVLHKDIKEIGESAFEGCVKLNEISKSNDHIIIKTDAFKGTAIFNERDATYINNTLTKVNPDLSGVFKVKDGTTVIADEAFKDCSKITEIILPESVITIGEGACANCIGLKNIVLPKAMEEIGMAAFDGCVSLEAVALPEGISEIPRVLFKNCDSLREVHIPQSVTRICFDAFTKCGLFKEYEESLEEELYIDDWLIYYKWKERESLCIREGTIGIADLNWIKPTKLCSVSLPDSLKYIGNEAFIGAPITMAQLPSNLQSIGMGAFRETHLDKIVIPKSVKKIEQWAFMRCKNIESITIQGKDTEVVWPAITGRPDEKQIEIYAPAGSKAEEYCLEYGQKNNLIFKAI